MGTEYEFLEKGIVKRGGTQKALDAFSVAEPDFRSKANLLSSEYIRDVWSAFINHPDHNSNLNGKVFEYCLISLLINKGILPIYVEAKAAFVPNVNFDLLLYTKEKPIVISAKTSLRERYKQADLEAIALKYVHRKAECYLLTLHEKEAASVNKKIKTGDVIGINEVILADTPRMDQFITELLALDFEKAGQVNIVSASSVIE